MNKILLGLVVFLTVVSATFAVPEVTIKVAAAKSGGLTEAQVRTGSDASYVTLAEAASITAPAFGFEVIVKDGENLVNGTWTLASTTYTLRRNNVVLLDGAGNSLLNRQLGAFNALGGAGPDIRGLDVNQNQSVPNFTQTSGGVTLSGTNSVILSAHSVAVGGSNRPLLSQYGDNYVMEYSMTGTFNGAQFSVTARAMVVVGAQVVWFDLQSPSIWKDGSLLVREPVVTEEGNVTDFVRGVRIAAPNTGKQYVIVGWESTTDLANGPWIPWNTTFPSGTFAPDGSGTIDVKAVAGRDGPYRFFRLKYVEIPGQNT